MKDKLETLYELCETISRELTEANDKIRKAGGKLSAGDIEIVDKLSHALKSIKTTMAMMEAEADGYSGAAREHYSGRMMPYTNSNGYYSDGSSYARGRYAKRDGMGRYSRGSGYSYADSMDSLLSEMRALMASMPEEKRRETQLFLEKMERM